MKLFLLLFLLTIQVLPQFTRKDISIIRGDYQLLYFEYSGDITEDSLTFVVKADTSISLPRLINKTTSQMIVVYNGRNTILTIILNQEDTQDLQRKQYWYDITADSQTIFQGKVTLMYDVQTPFDGTDLPDNGSRFYVAGTFVDSTVADSTLFRYDETTHSIVPIAKEDVWQFLNVSDTLQQFTSNYKSYFNNYYQLYDYQEPLLNDALQMQVRNAHYLFDSYYNKQTAMSVFDYDQTDSVYLQDRRTACEYLGLLNALYEVTGREIYLNKISDLYNDLITKGDTLVVSGGDACISIKINPLVNTEYAFILHDQDVHEAGIILYKATGNETYLNNTKNFMDVLYRSMNRNIAGEDGWQWNYFYHTQAVANNRVNIGASTMEFFGRMKEEGITSNLVSLALIDTLLDSTWAWINDAFITTGDTGGYALRTDLVDGIDFLYTFLTILPVMASVDGDTTQIENLKEYLQKIINYYTLDSGGNQTNKNKYYAYYVGAFLKWCKKLGIVTEKDSRHSNAWLRILTNHNHINGRAVNEVSFASCQRRSMMLYYDYLKYCVRYLNDQTFNEDYSQYALDNWTNSTFAFHLYDGYRIAQRRMMGTGIGYYQFCGYVTDDTSPLCPDPSAWTRSGEILTINYPAQANGKTYKYEHRLGSSFSKVTPSTADTLLITLHQTTNNYYLFYYDENYVLRYKSRAELTAMDTLTIIGNKGVFSVVINSAGSGIYTGVGMIWNQGATKFKHTRSDASLLADFFTSVDTIASTYVYYIDHNQSNFFQYNAGSFTYSKNAVENILAVAKQVLDNGLNYEGILENKLQ